MKGADYRFILALMPTVSTMLGMALVLAATLACGSSPSHPSPLPIGEPFELRVGRTAELADDVSVRFMEVSSDSRCPMDAVCVVAGEAIVRIIVVQRGVVPPPGVSLNLIRIFINGLTDPPCVTRPGSVDCVLRTSSGKAIIETETHTITLLQLAPYPRAATPIPPGDYVGTFIVTPR